MEQQSSHQIPGHRGLAHIIVQMFDDDQCDQQRQLLAKHSETMRKLAGAARLLFADQVVRVQIRGTTQEANPKGDNQRLPELRQEADLDFSPHGEAINELQAGE